MYPLLLRVFCPVAFRNEYGGEMRALFERRWRDAGLFGRVWVALEALADIITTGSAAHLELLRQDVRYALRAAGAAPGFSLLVMAVAALGIGAATSVFSVANHVYLRPLPFPEPHGLVRLWRDYRPLGYWRLETSPAEFRDWKRMTKSLESVAAYRLTSVNLLGAGDPQRLEGAAVTEDFFQVLGVAPLLGRAFTQAEDTPGGPKTTVLSYALWKRDFAGDSSIVGRTILLDSTRYTVIGVMPAAFLFPNREVRLWTATQFGNDQYADRNDYHINVFGRLKRSVTFDQASAELRSVGNQLRQQYPVEDKNNNIFLSRMEDEMSDRNRMLLTIVAAAAALLLLIACLNLANLLLARAASRGRELRVRSALGAGRERLVRQLLTESLLFAIAGGVLGVGLTALSVPLLAWLVPANLPVAETPALDWRVLGFAVSATMTTGILFGVLPAVRATRWASPAAVRNSSGERRERIRQILVALQVAASLALVISTGVMGRALLRLNDVAVGFETNGRLFFRTNLPLPEYGNTAKRERYYERVLGGLRVLPGVRTAAAISFRPLGPFKGGIWPVQVAGESGDGQFACARFVTPGYFDAMSIPLRRGRDLNAMDRAGSMLAAVVSESFVQKHWPGQSGLGQTFKVPFGGLQFTVVGVSGDVQFRGPERVSEPQFYASSAQMPDGSFTTFVPKDFVVATSLADPMTLAKSIQSVVAAADPNQPVSELQSLSALVAGETATRRTQLWVIGMFAVTALILAAVGIHGLLAFTVGQRIQEIGLRRALGASHEQIASLVFGEVLLLSGLGATAGATAAYASNRGIESLLAGVSPADPWVMALGFVVVILVTVTASIAPVVRALRVDPAAALRAE